MSRRQGRGYLFIRWSGADALPTRMGNVAWAFENIDTQGKFYCFHCGGSETGSGQIERSLWTQRCATLPELIKTMSNPGPGRNGYDEVKVFDVLDSDPDGALSVVRRLASIHNARPDILEETRQVLAAYGVRGLIASRAFSAPFLWYNILPGRSVPLRRLAVHLYEMRVNADTPTPPSPEDLEAGARTVAQSVDSVRGVGECFVTRLSSGFLIGLNIAVDSQLSVTESRRIADRVSDAVRSLYPDIRHLFVQTLPDEKLF